MNDSDYKALEQRVGRLHLKQRLGIEVDGDQRVFGRGRNFFHLENWYSAHSFIRACLRLVGMHGRGRRNARKLQIRTNTIVLPDLPEVFEGFTLCHISDLHLDISEDMPEAVAQCVQDLEYDACVLTGDYRARTYGPYQKALDGMGTLLTQLAQPVYGVLGNHDSIRMVPGLEAMGIQMLLNESVTFERKGQHIYMAGIDDPHYYRADNIEKAYQGIPDDEISILLSHSPEMYKHAAYAEFSVMLSGHTHGGQICLPGGVPVWSNASCPRDYVAGPWKYNSLIGYTSVGAGVSIVDVRVNCPPEITLHRFSRG
jgi:predicted MPP superfamily phosphohydrolase